MTNLNQPMFFFDVAVDVPLYQLFTYAHKQSLLPGTRVSIPYRNKITTGIVVQENYKPDIELDKIKAIVAILDDTPIFSEKWLQLIKFVATYYLYPIGQTFFNSLPADLKQNKPISFPEKSILYQFNANIEHEKAPGARFRSLVTLWNALKNSPISLEEAIYLHPKAQNYLKKYQEKGLIDTLLKNHFDNWQYRSKTLNQAQQSVSQEIIKHLHHFKTFLLFGITGSGKTEVYFEIMNKTITNKKQVLMLLPVINLTPQFFARVKATFPRANICILHSRISKKQRLDNYLNASTGNAQIIIGTRLAIFTPLKKLGLIIVDEEHDDSFKQENELRYHARDIAIWRAKQNACPVVLGSATPSLESWYHASQKKYELLTLQKRASSNATLPTIKLIATKQQTLREGFCDEVIEQIRVNLRNKQLTLVYLNRRGYAPTVVCFDCGHIIQCQFCSAKMVYHKQKQQLKCHHCNQEQTIPKACPDCGNQDLNILGIGTEKVEDFLRENFPTANIVRVDSDTTSKKNAWHDIYESILSKEVDILLGTQILAKGHDFENLSLVVILNADNSLFSADYRAPEKLFSELMQVSGRAGRSDIKGRVLIQTQFPEHSLFQSLQAHNYPEFAEQQLTERLALGFPPKSHRIVIKAEHDDFAIAEAFLTELSNHTQAESEVNIIGPLPMNMLKLANKERAMLYFESENRNLLHQTLKQVISKLDSLQRNYKNLKWIIDVDPHKT